MRISAGILKGRLVLAPEGRDVRPTSAKVRESIFDTLQGEVKGCRFLDLFAGSGAVGIEAYSRGAGEVYFCERNRDVLPLLKQNVTLLKGAGRVFEGDAFALMERLPGGFDVIFADPPYKDDCLERLCAVIERRGLLSKGGVLVYEHSSDLDVTAPKGYRIAKSKRYGSACVEYVMRGSICAATGSFDPMTKGHAEVVRRAGEMFDKVVVLIAVNDEKPSAFPLEVRKEIAEKATADMENVSVDICEGYVYKYCVKHGIRTIVRGLRSESERGYEQYMADYNRKKGGIDTVILPVPGMEDVSSTALREALKRGDDNALERLCAPGTADIIKKKFGELAVGGNYD